MSAGTEPGYAPSPPGGRIAVLDLARGIAVLGILAINVPGFAGPIAATLSPNLPSPGTFADEAWYTLALVLFEGKMRALFSLLFGASLLLFIERADAAGENGEIRQFRRLGWLAVFGYLHYLLFWWGDILFTYALAGFAALAMRNAPLKPLAGAALTLFACWHLLIAASGLPMVSAEERVLGGRAIATEVAQYRAERTSDAKETATELASYRHGFAAQIAGKLRNDPDEPIRTAIAAMGESLPLMLLGMVLYRSGFFLGRWRRKALRQLAGGGIALGGALTLGFAAWAWHRHFPPVLMVQALAYWLAIPHLLMALGYAAVIVLTAPRLAPTRLGQRLIAAGRMALSNYLGMTLVMTFLFYGWGMGLVGTVPERWQGLFVLGGWILMLGWSKPWLARFGQGPLERGWRFLTWGKARPATNAAPHLTRAQRDESKPD